MHNKQGNNEQRSCTCGPSPSPILAHGESHLPATLSYRVGIVSLLSRGIKPWCFEKTAAEMGNQVYAGQGRGSTIHIGKITPADAIIACI